LLLFQDIRSSNHILVKLRGLTTDELIVKLRIVFSTIQEALSNQQNPLLALKRQGNNERLRLKGQSIIGELRSLTGKTIETMMEALIKATIK